MSEQPIIAFLGTGIMGAPMARNIAAAGHAVQVWNRTRELALPLAEAGARVAESAAQAAEGADIVVTMLAHGPAVADVMTGQGAVLAHMPRGSLWIQMSTIGIDETERFAETARAAGVIYIDAPVLGTRQPAESGALVVLAAGPEEARVRCAAIFDAVGQKTLWRDHVGDATRLKLVVNHWVTMLTGIVAQNLAFARATGVDPADFLAVIAGGALDAPYVQVKGKAMIAGEFSPSFPLRLARKDVRLILDAAAQGGMELPMTTGLEALFAAAEARGCGDQDIAAILRGLGTSS
jgi:3-hydroxyisobutyrate dehydrogenase